MDTKAEISKLSSKSAKQLKSILSNEKNDYLLKLKEYLDDIYYNSDEESGFNDSQYDVLKEIIVERNLDDGIGAKTRSVENEVVLPYFLGSADKIKADEPKKLQNWVSKFSSPKFIIEDKLDGVSCLLVSKNRNISLYKRGNGTSGPDITRYASYIRSIPSNLPDIAVRGELIMKTKTFIDKFSVDYSNPRNFVNGRTTGNSEKIRAGLSDIDFVAYEIMSNSGSKSKPPTIQMKELAQLGFLTANYETISISDLSVENLSTKLKEFENKSSYEIDGLIVIPDESYSHSDEKYPKYMRAFKVNSEENIKETTVIEVKWQVSRYGCLTPVVHIEPKFICGAILSHPTGHNAKYIVDNNIGPGTVLQVTRSGAVIPFIVSIVKSTKAQMPDVPYRWNETEVDIYTTEDNDVMFIKRIATFFSQLGIKHVGEATVAKLYEHKFDTLFKILEADKASLLKIPRFGQKTVDRLYDNIHDGLKNVSLAAVLSASGTLEQGIGVKRITMLLDAIPDLLTVYKTISNAELVERISQIDGFADKTAEQIANNVQFADDFIKKLSKYATFAEVVTKATIIAAAMAENDNKPGTTKEVQNLVLNKKFVFSGFRNNFIQDRVGKKGGQFMSSVSKKTDAVIVKDKSDITGKLSKALELNIPVYTLEEFLEKYGIDPNP